MLDPRKVEEYKRYFAEFNVLVKGELDAEYKRVGALIVEWDKRNNLVQETAKLASAKTELATEQDLFLKDKAKQQATALAREEAVRKREENLTARLKEHDAARISLSAAQDAHASTSTATNAALDKRSSELAQKAKELEQLQSILHDRDVKLASREAEVRRVLSTLGSVTIR